jgi:arylsulfatase A-like enzyme
MHAPEKYLNRFPKLSGPRKIMAAMIAAVDDGVGEIRAELERNGMAENTFILFQSDNGPSRETRNWLDGTGTPYYGGSSGPFKGHKFSLFEGGIRVPGIVCYPPAVPAGRVVNEPVAAMDIFPTILRLAGGAPEAYELDGKDIIGVLGGGAPSPHETFFWEMGDQTAVRKGRHKLVLNGRLVEGEPPQDPVFLSDLDADSGETKNLSRELLELTEELRIAAETWRAAIEHRWKTEWNCGAGGTT